MRFSHFLSLIFLICKTGAVAGAVAAWPVWPVSSVVMETAGSTCALQVHGCPVPFSFVLLSISSIAFPYPDMGELAGDIFPHPIPIPRYCKIRQ